MTYAQEDKEVPPWPARTPKGQGLTPTMIPGKRDVKYITVTLKFEPGHLPTTVYDLGQHAFYEKYYT